MRYGACMEVGICKLCLLEKDLCNSHYIPAAAYKYNRATELKNPHPVMLTGGSPKQGTAQIRDYAFCVECENRFRTNGETWVLGNIPHDDGESFPLRDAALASPPAIVEHSRVLIAGKTTTGFDMDQLIYFGTSVFWRGGAHRWPPIDGTTVPEVQLGSYQEELRLFLLGTSSFPAAVSLTVMLWPFEKVRAAILFPDVYPGSDWVRYWFYINGLGFVLDVGTNVPTRVQRRSTSHSPEQLVTISKEFGDMVWKRMKELVGKDSSRLGPMLKEIEAVRSKSTHTKQPREMPIDEII